MLISSVGMALSPASYRVELTDPFRATRSPVDTRCGLAVVASCLPAEIAELDVLLLTTEEADPPDANAYPAGQRCAAGIVELEVDRLASGTPRYHRRRLPWVKAPIASAIDGVVGLPHDLVSDMRTLWDRAPGDYDLIVVDMAAGLRTIGLGLWLTVAYLREVVDDAAEVRAVYAEADSRPARPFDITPEPSTRGPVGGRVVDVTDFFHPLSAVGAANHLIRSLDYRTLLRLLEQLAPGPAADALRTFAEPAQLGLDMAAASAAGAQGTSGHAPGATGRERLAGLLVAEVLDSTSRWERPAGARPAPVPSAPKTDWPLDPNELVRVAGVIDLFRERGRLADVAIHLREYLVTCFQLASNETAAWLQGRTGADRKFGQAIRLLSRPALLARRGVGLRPNVQAAIQLATQDVRNVLAHAGRRPTWVDATDLADPIGAAWDALRPPAVSEIPSWLETGWPGDLYRLATVSGPPVLVAAVRSDAVPHVRAAFQRARGDDASTRAILLVPVGFQTSALCSGAWCSSIPTPISRSKLVGGAADSAPPTPGGAAPTEAVVALPIPVERPKPRRPHAVADVAAGLLKSLTPVHGESTRVIHLAGTGTPYLEAVSHGLAAGIGSLGATVQTWMPVEAPGHSIAFLRDGQDVLGT